MDTKNITRLHQELLQGISIEDLNEKSLLKLGSTLLKQFRGSKAVLRRLEDHEYTKANEWIVIKECCSANIDVVLQELEKRMATDLDEFGGSTIISFCDLVGAIRLALVDEERLDNDTDDTEAEVNLIFE